MACRPLTAVASYLLDTRSMLKCRILVHLLLLLHIALLVCTDNTSTTLCRSTISILHVFLGTCFFCCMLYILVKGELKKKLPFEVFLFNQ